MRVYVSADIEGTTGIAHWDEADKAHRDYAWFVDRMNREVGAACDGALAGGATGITVKDAHGTARNLVPDRLPQPTQLIRGWSGHPYAMVQEIDGSYGAVAFVGYHSPSGSGGHPLSHTLTGKYARIELDGERLSELRMSALTARSHGVPTVFVSGDANLCAEAEAAYPDAVVVPSGRGVGHSTVARHPMEVEGDIRDGMAEAVRRVPRIRVAPMPGAFVLDVRFRVHHDAYRASHYPGAEAIDDDRVRLRAAAWIDVLRALMFWK
ncbi:MAG: M55 family metallopeptidase [Myxococcota bacterium]